MEWITQPGLVATITGQRDGNMFARIGRQKPQRNRRGIGKGLVAPARSLVEAAFQLLPTQLEYMVLCTKVAGDDLGVAAFSKVVSVERHSKSAQRVVQR